MNVHADRNCKIRYKFLLLLHIELKNRGSDPLFLLQNMCYNQISAEVPLFYWSRTLQICEHHDWKQIFISNSSSASVVMHLRMSTVPKGHCKVCALLCSQLRRGKFYLDWSTFSPAPFPSQEHYSLLWGCSESTKVTLPGGIWNPRLSCKHEIQRAHSSPSAAGCDTEPQSC